MAGSGMLKQFVCCMHRASGRIPQLTQGHRLMAGSANQQQTTALSLLPAHGHGHVQRGSSLITSVQFSSQSGCSRFYGQDSYPGIEIQNQDTLPVTLSHTCAGASSFLTSRNKVTWKHSSRSFKTKADKSIGEETDRVVSQLKHEEGVLEDNAGWLIRLSNENNYLSWCRNVYISTIAGATVYGQFLVIPHSKEAGVLLLMMGGINLLSGTGLFLYNLVHLREKMMMRRMTVIFHMSSAVLHMLLWFGCMAIYIGYVEADEEDIDDKDTTGFKSV